MARPSPVDPTEELRAKLEAQEKALAETRELLEAAEKLRQAGYSLSKSATSIPVETLSPWAKPTWAGTMLRILEEAGGSLPHKELLTRIETSPVFPALTPGFKNFYGTMERLKRRGDLTTHAGVVYTTKAFQELVAANVPLPKVKRSRAPLARELIGAILRDNPKGLTCAEIEEKLKALPEQPTRAKYGAASSHYVQRTMDAMVRLGRAVYKEGRYRLPATMGPLKKRKAQKRKAERLSERPALQVATLSGQDPDLSGLH